ncbi:hypothetical protein [Longimicrobium sp.]|uniref:hypothetical protein n=1 Tax=Longimicrobium sp. TaxID=2029185 RepID=UPI002ED898D0
MPDTGYAVEHGREPDCGGIVQTGGRTVSPIILNEISGTKRRLRFRDGARAFPVAQSDGQLLVVHDAELDIHAYGQTCADVLTDLVEQIEMMWMEYAEADEAQLTAGAASLARLLRERLAVQGDDA